MYWMAEGASLQAGAKVISTVASAAKLTSIPPKTRRLERPIFSSPTTKIAGKNRMPVSFETVASPTAIPQNPANHQLPLSAHRHPRYRARVEKKIKKTSNVATRPKARVSGEIVHRASARTPLQ